jgi:hypothetical protein
MADTKRIRRIAEFSSVRSGDSKPQRFQGSREERKKISDGGGIPTATARLRYVIFTVIGASNRQLFLHRELSRPWWSWPYPWSSRTSNQRNAVIIGFIEKEASDHDFCEWQQWQWQQ